MFTSGATAQDFSICLRCQSRLSLKNSIRPNRRRQIGVSAHRRAFTSGNVQRQEDRQSVHDGYPSLPPSQIRHFPAKFDKDGVFRPPPKQPLGMESLGIPAEVLVMRKKPRAPQKLGDIYTKKPLKPLPPTLEDSPEALLDGIDSTRGIVDIEHVCANIDTIRNDFLESRARKEQNLSREEYDELLKRLSDGFQKDHLLAYFQRSRSKVADDSSNLSFPYRSTILTRTEWYSEASSKGKRISAPPLMERKEQDFERQPLSFTGKGKHWHAENIIKSCWGLQKDLHGKIGMMGVRLQPTHLKLLLSHASNPLKTLSQTYSVKFEVSKVQGSIFVEADVSTCEDVLRMLLQLLNRIKSTHILLETGSLRVPNMHLNKGYIEEIEGLTGTVIRRERASRTLDGNLKYTVYHLGPEESDLEDVRRLLNNEASAKMANAKGGVWIKAPVNTTTSAIPKEFGESLPLIARSTQWARFVDEHGRRFDSEAERAPLPAEKPLDAFPYSDLVVNEVHRFLSHRGKSQRFNVNDVDEHWETNLTRWSQVILGQVAFPLHQAQKLEAKLKRAKTNADLVLSGVNKRIFEMKRIFATTLPGMTRALEAADLSLHPVERLVIRMVPSSALGLAPEFTNLIPELEILVRANLRDKTIQLQTVRLVLVHEEQDLLLPSHATDLRLMRREYLYCNQEENNENDQQPSDPCLAAFIAESQLDIWGSQRLRTPNHLQLSIPTCSIPVLGSNGPLLNSNSIPVNYSFANIEHRSFVSLAPIGMYTPEYNTIQAGRTGGRREELAIRLGRQSNMNRPWDIRRDTAKGLLEAALQVVRSMR